MSLLELSSIIYCPLSILLGDPEYSILYLHIFKKTEKKNQNYVFLYTVRYITSTYALLRDEYEDQPKHQFCQTNKINNAQTLYLHLQQSSIHTIFLTNIIIIFNPYRLIRVTV